MRRRLQSLPSSRRRVAYTAVHKEAHLDYLYGVPFVILDKEALGTDGYIHRTWTWSRARAPSKHARPLCGYGRVMNTFVLMF